ncbi:uncharacterized protein LOC128591761 isoform X3 [Nycticebus coucang]|uniref:uncharacterized protein LOC128591761 isoform X3 n=1 Tax=Nycticebus coucang TaxID=9470 RepID=UPI00234DAF39|nr:uncharacterized protein LOC128591761 isoform X3 [Nycticebus coucang]
MISEPVMFLKYILREFCETVFLCSPLGTWPSKRAPAYWPLPDSGPRQPAITVPSEEGQQLYKPIRCSSQSWWNPRLMFERKETPVCKAIADHSTFWRKSLKKRSPVHHVYSRSDQRQKSRLSTWSSALPCPGAGDLGHDGKGTFGAEVTAKKHQPLYPKGSLWRASNQSLHSLDSCWFCVYSSVHFLHQ